MPEEKISSTKARQREIQPHKGEWSSKTTVQGTGPYSGQPFTDVLSSNSGEYNHSGTQYTESEGHQWRTIKGLHDVGGPFFTQKSYVGGISSARVNFSVPAGFHDWVNHYEYSGPILPVAPDSNGVFPFPPSHLTSDDDLDEIGATAIARANPENAIVELSTTLGELITGGLPSLVGSSTWKDRTKAAQKAGHEYLNVQFGWLPLVSDVNKFIDVVRNANAVLKQYERDAGRPVRRRIDLSSTTSESESMHPDTHAFVYGSGGNFLKTSGIQVLRRSISQRRWFSGAFMYHLPTGYNARSEMDRIHLLTQRVGLAPTPDTLWNLAPWSWAVDWFSNAGDVVSNVSSFSVDGTVLAYGYLMEHTIVRDTYTLTGVRDQADNEVRIAPLTLVTETKVRKRANPYGFGVQWEGLSAFQLSILTALGLTKGRR
jgi:hypothetical protein